MTKITSGIDVSVAGFGSLVGATWGDFAIGDILGRGGMGAVFRGRQSSLDRQVAIKILPPELAERQELRERFLREARAIAQVASPHIVQVYHAGTHHGWHFYAMELLDGEDLGRRLRDGWRPSLGEAQNLTLQAARGLAAAARFGIVHRDIKPANMLFGSDGTLKLTDFGLVRRAGDEELTSAGQIMGTASYISPEQALGRNCDARSDLYSLGVVFYELLTGTLPFTGDSITGVVYQHIHEAPVPSEQRNPAIDPASAMICATLLAKEPEQRYQSAADLVTDLEALCAGRSTRIFRAARRRRRWPIPVIAATVCLAVAGALWYNHAAEREAARQAAAEQATLAAQAAAATERAAAEAARTRQAADEARERSARELAAAREAARHDAHGRFADLACNGVRFRLRELPPGKARLGSPPDEEGRSRDETPIEVRFSTTAWIGSTEVTQRQWQAVMGSLPAQAHAGDDLPVANITKLQADSFCARLNQAVPGLRARLPSELEWERAARAGGDGPWADRRPLATQAWYDDNAGGAPHAVGGFPPNSWGLHDMHGNVAEWTADCYASRSSAALTDPPVLLGDGKNVIKGGAYDDDSGDCRLAGRETGRSASKRVGFRIFASQLPDDLR